MCVGLAAPGSHASTVTFGRRFPMTTMSAAAMSDFPFEVEHVLEAGGETYVLARSLSCEGFKLSEVSTLGGIAIKKWLSQPRALKPDGSPRYDLFSFHLCSRSDRGYFQPGQRLGLRALRPES